MVARDIILLNGIWVGVTPNYLNPLYDNLRNPGVNMFTSMYIQKILAKMGFRSDRDYLKSLPGHNTDIEENTYTHERDFQNYFLKTATIGNANGTAQKVVFSFLEASTDRNHEDLLETIYDLLKHYAKIEYKGGFCCLLSPTIKDICYNLKDSSRLRPEQYSRLWYCSDWESYRDKVVDYYRDYDDNGEYEDRNDCVSLTRVRSW